MDRTPYPPEWPSPASDSDVCRSINGVYGSRAVSQTFEDPQRDHLLALVLLPLEADYRHIKTVSIEYADAGELGAVGYADDGVVLADQTYDSRSGFFTCDDGYLRLRPDRKPGREQAPDSPLVGWSSEEVSLRKATDGSLIMRRSGSATGLAFLVVPVHVETEHWYRFEPVRSASE